MIKPSLFLLASFMVAAPLSAQEEPPKEIEEPKLEHFQERYFGQLVKAYQFLVFQQEGLKAVAEQHPELDKNVKLLTEKISKSRLAPGFEALIAELQGFLRKDWKESSKVIRDKIVKDQFSKPIDRKTADKIIARFAMIEQGQIPNDILRLVLGLHPEYAKEPLKEIEAGWVVPYSTVRAQSAHELELSVDLPASWKPKDVKSKNNLFAVVQKAGYGLATLSLTAIPVSDNLYQETYAALTPAERAKKLIPPKGKILSIENAKFAESDGALTTYELPVEEDSEINPPRIIQYSTYQAGHFILFQLSLGLVKAHDPDFFETKFTPLFKHCAESLVAKKP